jgi:hypothetical protein
MDLQVYGVSCVSIIVALVELAKRSFGLPSRFAAPLAVVLGLFFAFLLKLDQPTVGSWLQVELTGLMAGLSASGLYSGVKSVARG